MTGHGQLVRRYLAPQRGAVSALAGALGLAVALPLVNPQIIRAFIDRVAGSDTALGPLMALAGAYIGVAAAKQAANVGTNYLSQHVGWTATNLLRADLARHATGLDMSFHNRHTPGEMIERIDGDVTAMANFLSSFLMNIVWAALLIVGILALIFREDARVGLVLVAFTVLGALAMFRLRSVATSAWASQRERSAGMFGFLEERLAGLDDLRSLGAGDHVMKGFFAANRDLYRVSYRAERTGNVMWVCTSALFVVGNVIALAMGAWLYARGEATIGTVYLLFQYFHMIHDPLEIVAEQLRDFQKAAAGAARVQDLFSHSSSIADGPGATLPAGPLAASFGNVSFAYNGDGDVVREVTFAVRPGAVLGVLGRTGSGKTTLARLLLRLYDVQDGAVRVGGVDVRDARLGDLRARVGYVTQDVQLFRASVRDNVTLFTDGHDDARIVDVLDDLGLGGWFRSLPNGLDTELDGGLSAGEAQLLAFARVFLRDPGLVILDEASSRLDPATERLIEHAVDRLLQGRTGIVIAHRLGTLDRADGVLVLDDGRVAEHGPRATLASDPGSRFAHLLRTGLQEVLA